MPGADRFGRIADLMDQQAEAAWTWLSLVRGNPAFPGRLGETTLTEFIQAQLWSEWTGQVRYVVPDEPTTGADWEWFIGLSGVNRWISIRVQAKILSRGLKFESIAHKVGGKRQIDVLIESARSATCRTIPYYVFYVSDVPSSAGSVGLQLPLHGWKGMSSVVPREHFGCTAVDAHTIRSAYEICVGARSSPCTYVPFGFPWSQLLRSFDQWIAANDSFSSWRGSLGRLLRLLNVPEESTAAERYIAQGIPVLRDWLRLEDVSLRAPGTLPEYARTDFDAARERTVAFRRERRTGLLPATARPPGVRPMPRGTAAYSMAEPRREGDARPALTRPQRPLGAPRLGISFLDLDSPRLE